MLESFYILRVPAVQAIKMMIFFFSAKTVSPVAHSSSPLIPAVHCSSPVQ